MTDTESARSAAYWAQYNYTAPVREALDREFGVQFGLQNTGGGCICLEAAFRGNVYVLVGSGGDGPLWRGDERDEYHAKHGHYDGYGVGVYDAETGYTRAYVTDVQANTGDAVAELLRRALSMANDANDDTYPSWRRGADGEIKEARLRV